MAQPERTKLLPAFAAMLVLAIASPQASALSEADDKTGKYVLACDSAGKPEAVYECALESSVKAGVVSNSVADACRADTAGAGARRHAETWACAKLRQFAASLPQREWQSATFNDCQKRSLRPGNRYQGRHHQCVVDAYVEHKRASPQRIATCDATEPTPHGKMNCLARDEPAAAAEPALSPRQRSEAQRTAGPDERVARLEECAAFNVRTPELRAFPEVNFTSCRSASEPPAEVWAAAKATAQKARDAKIGADRAAYPPDQARTQARTACESQNRSSPIQFHCACVHKEADRHLAENKLSTQAIGQLQFDLVPCIDRPRSAVRLTDQTPRSMLTNAGIDADAMVACHRDAIENKIEGADLLDAGRLRGQLGPLCPPKMLKR